MTADPAQVVWIAADWGTSQLRAWAMGPAGVLARAGSNAGMGALSRDGYEPALLALVADWLAPDRVTPVIACGMVGSRQGWVEAPYQTVPCPPLDPEHLARAPTAEPRLTVEVIPGLKQTAPADVMRGEETQIAGFLSHQPGFDGVLCLPGTHTKWVRISAGEVVSFQTFMTGEMFALLADRSVLRHSVAAEGWDDDAFAEAVADALSRPDRLAARLFTLRAEGLIAGLAPAAARARLSGALIGAELAAARPYWLGQSVAILGAPALSRLYAAALEPQGLTATQQPAEEMTLAGLALAHSRKRITA
jgi:2-dehydro-3-deoxygalactonokinase